MCGPTSEKCQLIYNPKSQEEAFTKFLDGKSLFFFINILNTIAVVGVSISQSHEQLILG